MTIDLFTFFIIVILVALWIIFARRIVVYFGNIFYLFLAILYVSNLGYLHEVQLTFRCFAISLPWMYILFVMKGKIALIKCNYALILLFYLFVCLISTFWSTSPIQTFFKSIELITDVIVIWYLYSIESNRNKFIVKSINLLMGLSACLLTVTMMGFFLVPSYFANTGYSSSQTILGIRIGEGLIGANQTGAVSILVLAWFILLIYNKNLLGYCILFISLIAMLFSQSRASLILIPLIAFLRLFKPKSKYTSLYLMLIFVILLFLAINIDLLLSYLLRGQSAADFNSLSGRKMIWSYAFEYISKCPILGYGFGAGGELVGQVLPGAFNGLQHMHNGIVETLLGTGTLGCILIVLPYLFISLTVFKRLLKEGIKNNLYDIVILFFFAIRTYTSLGIGSWQSLEIIIWYVFIFIMSSKNVNIQGAFKLNGDNIK